MPHPEFVPDGYDPTEQEYKVPGPNMLSCLGLIAVCLLFCGFLYGGINLFFVPKAAPTPTRMIEMTTAPSGTPTITLTPSMTPTGTLPPTASPTVTPTITPTETPTVTPGPSATPFPGAIWLSVRAVWPKRAAYTRSGVDWRNTAEVGAACPNEWTLGNSILLESGERYICVDRAASARCVDAVCTVLVFSQKSIPQQLRRAVLLLDATPQNQPTMTLEVKKK